MQDFYNIRFPENISINSTSGIKFITQITASTSGKENRRNLTPYGIGEYEISNAIKSKSELDELISFFRIANGKLHSFRFKDWNDYTATNQAPKSLNTNTQTTNPESDESLSTLLQLQKTYKIGQESITRIITKPVTGTVQIFRNSDNITHDFTIDHTTGILFSQTQYDLSTLTTNFEFDIQARFNTDSISFNIKAPGIPTVESVKISEIFT